MCRLAAPSADRRTRLPVHEGLEDFVHHAEMIVTFVLPLHIHEVFAQGVEPPGQQTSYVKTCGG